MTSELTREKAQWLHDACEEAAAAGIKLTMNPNELLMFTSYALAAMDSEPVAVTDDMAYAFHHALTDSMIGADDVEEIKTGLRAVFANLTAPVVSSEYPERLPCSVLLEPGLRFGKGIKTSTMLAALSRRAVHASDMAALSQEERAEFQARIEGFKALIAQPAPVVPDDLLSMAASAIEDLLEHTDPNTSYYSGVWADMPGKLRAAMLNHSGDATEKGAVIGIDPASGPDHSVEVRYIAPPGYVMVPKEPTAEMIWAAKYCFTSTPGWDVFKSAYIAMLAAAPQEVNHG